MIARQANSSSTEKDNLKHQRFTDTVSSLISYGDSGLFIINTINNGFISLNTQPLAFKLQRAEGKSYGTIAVPIDETQVIPQAMYKVTVDVINNMNVVLEQIIPGLTIAVKNLGEQTMQTGELGTKIEVVSKKIARKFL